MSGERARAGLLIAAGLVAVTSVWWAPALMRRMKYFEVRHVQVTGARYRAPSAIIAALRLPDTMSVFGDLAAIEDRLARLPGIEEGVVGRRLPGTLTITVREVEPVALAQGRDGLQPVDGSGHPLPYDLTAFPVDAPLVGRPDARLAGALAAIRTASGALYAMASAASLRGSEVVLDVGGGMIRLDAPVADGVVSAVMAVQRDLESRAVSWREIDGRFRGWVVVR